MTTLAVLLVLTAAVTLAAAGWHYRRHLAVRWARLTRRQPVQVEGPDGIVTIPGTLTEQQLEAFRAQWQTPAGPATGEWRHNVRRLPRSEGR